jgi:hypothetical protein
MDNTAMRLVLDQGVPRDAAAQLRALGYPCTHAGEIGMSKAADDEILAWSLGQNATVVTLDADSHAILAVTGASDCEITPSFAVMLERTFRRCDNGRDASEKSHPRKAFVNGAGIFSPGSMQSAAIQRKTGYHINLGVIERLAPGLAKKKTNTGQEARATYSSSSVRSGGGSTSREPATHT